MSGWKAWKGESTVTQTGERSESINAMYGVERSEQGSRKDKKQENIPMVIRPTVAAEDITQGS